MCIIFFYVAMWYYLKKNFLQFVLFWTFLLIITLFLLTNPYDNVSIANYNEVYNRYFKPRNSIFIENRTTQMNHLFNITNFTFLINPKVDFCNGTSVNMTKVKVVFIITSYINNVEIRSVMRRSFPEDVLDQLGIRRVFLLGITPDNKYINQRAIEDEARRFGDIVQGNFLEAYRNLTYKHIMGLKWVTENCHKAHFVIKMDDDIIINMPKVMDLLNFLKNDEKFIAGYVLKGLKAKRERANKWFVTKEEYPLDYYPTFVSGWLYITTPIVCKELLQVAENIKYFWIDDVYVTGILAEKINIITHDLKKYFTDHAEYFQCCMNDLNKFKFDCDIVIGPNGGRTDLFYEFNQAFSICAKGVCLKRSFPINESCVGTKNLNLGRGNPVISAYQLV